MKSKSPKIELNMWKFQIDQENVGESFGWHLSEYDHSAWMEVSVPSAWDFYEIALRNYEGAGWYYAEFQTLYEEDVRHVLDFTGVGGQAWVWVNGRFAWYNATRYLSFDIDIEQFIEPDRQNVIVIKVDNRFRGKKHMTGGSDIEWVLYGGLIHKIHLRTVPVCSIDRMDIKTDYLGRADITVSVKNGSSTDFEGELLLNLDTESACEARIAVVCCSGRYSNVKLNMKAESFAAWSPENPVLYNMRAALLRDGKPLHETASRIGFRTIECKGTRILLNGKPIFIKGVNRYDEIHPYGPSAPDEVIRQDLEHIKRCGANLIRVHYPQDPVHLEIADEIGLFYMLEIPLNWWYPQNEETLQDYKELEAEAIDALERIYKGYGNHPCWIIWSMSNECEYRNKAGNAMMRMLAERARNLDCRRLVTAVVYFVPNGQELDFCDIIAFNDYRGADKPVKELRELEKYIVEPTRDDIARLSGLYPNKPIVMCEFGALSIIGLRGESRMSEDRHKAVLDYTFNAMEGSKNLCGFIIWAWADYFHNRSFFSSSTEGLHINTAFGPFGVVTADRRIKKCVYETFLKICDYNPAE